MSLFRELSYDGPEIDEIKSIQFCLQDPEEIKRRSVVHVTLTDSFIGSEPVLNGLYDPRMGVTDSTRLCGTCEQRSTFCPGHFGHIELAQPCFFYQYMPFVKKLLQCVCIRCSKLMVDADSPDMLAIQRRSQRQNRFNNVHKLCSKVLTCGQHSQDGCGARNPDKVTKNCIKGFVLEWKAGVLSDDSLRKQNFGAPEVLKILQRIRDRDVEALGMSPKYSRPEWMICTVLPVPPPAVRPCLHHETGQRQEDDLSYTLCHIIKNNNILAQKIKKGDRQEYIDGFALQLQYYMATLVDNQIQGITPPTHKRSGRTLRSLSDRLKGKEGRIRGNLMGKRVDFSARSVITPDPNISIDEVGVPLRIAMNLTFPEVVSDLNRETLQRLVASGPDQYPGAKMVRKTREGRVIRLKNVDRSGVHLDDGDVVERHLLDGDYILFNRQPSLHRMSMMGHRVRVMPFNTFRISTSVCASFNADFDGDEMNAHVPQSHTTAVELEQLAGVTTQILSPKHSAPIIGIVQDTVLGVWRLTRSEDVLLDRQTMFNAMAVCHRVPRELPAPEREDPKRGPLWTGRQLLSTILPPDVSVTTKNSADQVVRVVNGQLLEGAVDSQVYQRMSDGLVHATFNECGPIATRNLFDDTQKLVCFWLANTGFSVGVSDLVADGDVLKHIEQVTRDMKQRVYSTVASVHAGQFENPELMSNGAYLENQIINCLNSAEEEVSNAITDMLNKQGNNRMLQMIMSGAKGKRNNMTQMVGFLGQQVIEGSRVPEGFENRTLPHFTRFDDGPDARGWVQSSFFSGLSPVEYFFHAMGGRVGLVDTAIKSVTYETPIVVIEHGMPRYVRIGEWVDAHMASNGERIQHRPEDRNMELLELTEPAWVPTCDDDGRTSWAELTAVTRHDPGERLYEVTTESGRRATVAESKSLLIWDGSKLQAKDSRDIQVGDRVPVTVRLPDPPNVVSMLGLFSLNVNNGLCIGVFLAGGTLDASLGTVQVTASKTARDFLLWWFQCRGIQARLQGDTVSAECPELVHFLSRHVIRPDGGKHVPDAAFASPLQFVESLLHGYIRTDSPEVSDGGDLLIPYSTARMADGIAMLCTRLGVFASIEPDGVLRVPSRWVDRIMYQSDPLRQLPPSPFQEQEDVVLDRIVSVNVIGTHGHPKLYDVSVPSTLNFGLANGMLQHDTADIGYLQRKLVKAMEDCKVHYDRSVRNASGQIVQFGYGEDGMDSTHLERQRVLYSDMEPLQFATSYSIGANWEDELASSMEPDLVKRLRKDPEAWLPACQGHFMALAEDRERLFAGMFPRGAAKPDVLLYPVAFDRILTMAHNLSGQPGQLSDLHPAEALAALDNLVATQPPGCSLLFGILCRMYLAPKRLLLKYRMRRAQFEEVLRIVRQRHVEAAAHAGEMVGVLAAQSIGEPATQMTLNSFHSAGHAMAFKATQGVPRLRELLSATRKIKTPMMTIVPEPLVARDKALCNNLLNRLEVLRFDHVVSRTRIYYDPSDLHTAVAEDKELTAEHAKFSGVLDPQSCQADADATNPWLLRLDINRDALVERGASMLELADALTESYEHRVRCIFSDESSPSLVFRLRLDKPEMDDVLMELRALESHLMEGLVVWGVSSVRRATMSNRWIFKYNLDTKAYERVQEWVLYTDGTDLRTVLGREGVDARYTVTNDVVEICQVLGIEAARQALINEFGDVMNDSKVNFRHISLLVDNMTHRGRIMSVDRFGINRSDIGVLSKASFEESVEQIITSAVFAESDPMTSVAANVMLGQVAPCGTGQTGVEFDVRGYVAKAKELGVSTAGTNGAVVFEGDDNDGDGDLLASVASAGNFFDPALLRMHLPAMTEKVIGAIPLPEVRVLEGV